MESSTCICENKKYLKDIANTSVIECDDVLGNEWTKMWNAIATATGF